MEDKNIRDLRKEESEKEKKSFKTKAADFGKGVVNGVKNGAKKAWDFTKENEKHMLVLIGGGFAALKLIKEGKEVLGLNKTAYERDMELKQYHYYDPVSRRTYYLRRKPTSAELSDIEYRHRFYKEPIADILIDLGLIR